MAKKKKDRVDPAWPEAAEDKQPVSEFLADRQGAMSPFGDVTFPIESQDLRYQHPVTRINR